MTSAKAPIGRPTKAANHHLGIKTRTVRDWTAYLLPPLSAIAFLVPLLLVALALTALSQVPSDTLPEGHKQSLFATIQHLITQISSDIYSLRAIQFTLFQALLSAFLSVLFAIPLARAFAFRSFPGRTLLLSLFGAPFILPVIVAILGILAIWGQTGTVNTILKTVSGETINIYGLAGILIAHVFFNLPLATRILLQGWQSIPAEQWRLAAQLAMPTNAIARWIEWPMLKQRIPGIFALVFLICVTSFTIILALGGGPKATTIELAIYQAIRFDFDLPRAALLALTQIVICTGLAIIARLLGKDHDTGFTLGGAINRPDLASTPAKAADTLIILCAILFLGAPLVAALGRGLVGLTLPSFQTLALSAAILRSLAIALSAAAIMLLISLPLAHLAANAQGKRAKLLELPGFAIMVAPPIALGAGLFVLLHAHIALDDMALPMTTLLNGLQAVPFALILLTPALKQARTDYLRLMQQLGIHGWTAAKLVYVPIMRKPLAMCLGIAAALSVGDLGVIALFGSPSEPTLPLYLYQLMGAYKMDEAYVVGLILTGLAFGLFYAFDRLLGGSQSSGETQ